MSWIGWVVIGILGFNALFFGALLVIHMKDELSEREEDDGRKM